MTQNSLPVFLLRFCINPYFYFPPKKSPKLSLTTHFSLNTFTFRSLHVLYCPFSWWSLATNFSTFHLHHKHVSTHLSNFRKAKANKQVFRVSLGKAIITVSPVSCASSILTWRSYWFKSDAWGNLGRQQKSQSKNNECHGGT